MGKKRVPGWIYLDSETLGMEVAYNPDKRIAMTEDLTVYDMNEVYLLHELGLDLPLEVHLIKNMCKGKIIKVLNKK